jgi:hypothetical protein
MGQVAFGKVPPTLLGNGRIACGNPPCGSDEQIFGAKKQVPDAGAKRLILACGDVDSWAPSSARGQGTDIPLYFRRFLQLDVSEGRTRHESGSASFGIRKRETDRGALGQ